MKIVFMGTPSISVKSLELLSKNNEILGVVTKPDAKTGRGMKIKSSEVKEYSLKKGFTIFEPERIKNNIEFIEEIRKLNPDLICVIAYGKILPKEILEIPKYGCINLHGSILPKYRGAAPIQRAVLNGDKITGVTTIFMDESMDTGDMILSKEIEILDDDTSGTMFDKIGDLGAEVFNETIEKIKLLENKIDLEDVKKRLKVIKQSEAQATYADMILKDEANIDWTKSADEINNKIRGLNPFLGAKTKINDKNYKIWKAKVIKDEFHDLDIGEIILLENKRAIIKAGKDNIEIIEIQPENSKKMDIQAFLRGNSF